VQWLYGQTMGVFVWGRDGRESAVAAGVASGKITLLPPPDVDSGPMEDTNEDELNRLRAARTGATRPTWRTRADGFDAFWDRLVAAAGAARTANSQGRDNPPERAAQPGSTFAECAQCPEPIGSV
jgi:hypothetical protein